MGSHVHNTVVSVRHLARQHPDWLPTLWAAWMCAKRAASYNSEFTGSWVVQLVRQTAGHPTKTPGLRILVDHGLITPVGRVRDGRPVYYTMDDQNGVAQALIQLQYPVPFWQLQWFAHHTPNVERTAERCAADLPLWTRDALKCLAVPAACVLPPACAGGLPLFPPAMYQHIVRDVPDSRRRAAIRHALTETTPGIKLAGADLDVMVESIVTQCDAGLEHRLVVA